MGMAMNGRRVRERPLLQLSFRNVSTEFNLKCFASRASTKLSYVFVYTVVGMTWSESCIYGTGKPLFICKEQPV